MMILGNNQIRIRCGIGEGIIIENGFMRVARSPHKLKFPQNLDVDLAYLAGYHLGDGYLENVYKTFTRQGRGSYEIDYADNDINQIKLINNIIKNKFNYELKVYKRPNVNLWLARTCCKVLHWFLNKKLGLPVGERNKISIPKWILKDKSFLSNFLSGFFDAESDISKTPNIVIKSKKYYRMRIQLTQKDKNILFEIKDVLSKYFEIKSDIQQKWKQEAYILRIGSFKMVEKFQNDINFRNENKRGKLKKLISSF